MKRKLTAVFLTMIITLSAWSFADADSNIQSAEPQAEQESIYNENAEDITELNDQIHDTLESDDDDKNMNEDDENIIDDETEMEIESDESYEIEEEIENSEDEINVINDEDSATDFEDELNEDIALADANDTLARSAVSCNIPVNRVSADYKMDSNYAFTYAFRSGKTKLASISRYNSNLNNKVHKWYGDDNGYTSEYCKTFYVCEIDNDTHKDPITAVYSNVGEYQGQIVDLKVTALSWGNVDKNHVGLDGTKITPCLLFYKDRIAMNTLSTSLVRFKFEFLKHNTQTKVNVKGHITFADLDSGQGVRVHEGSGIQKVFLRSGYEHLSVTTGCFDGGKPYREIRSAEGVKTTNDDPKGWCQVQFDGSLAFSWLSQSNWTGVTYPQNAFFVSTGLSVGTYEPNPQPEKRVGNDGTSYSSMSKHEYTSETSPYRIAAGQNYDYIISQRILPGNYSSFVLTDKLDACLKYRSASVTTSGGNDVTSKFKIVNSNNTITFTADTSFLKTDEAYNDVVYYFRIKVTAGSNTKIAAHNHYGKSNNYYSISNKASRTIVSNLMKDTQSTNESWVNGEISGQYGIRKVDKDDSTKLLNGAEFELYQWDKSKNKYVSLNKKAGYQELDSMYHTGTLKMTTSNLGKFRIVETKAPDGYSGGWSKDVNVVSDESSEKIITAENTLTEVPLGEIKVTKKIKESDIIWAHGNPIFRIRVTGTDMNGSRHMYEKYIEFGEDNYDVDGEYAILSCRFENIPLGNYAVSELETLRYKFESVSADTSNVKVSGDTAIVELDRNTTKAGVTFINIKKRFDRYSHTDAVTNIIPVS